MIAVNTDHDARPAFEPGVFYRVIFTRPVGLEPGVTIRPGVLAGPIAGERLTALAEYIEQAEAI